MGFKQSLICPNCNYKSFTSAGPDRGFTTWTNTFICEDCKSISDLVIRDNRVIDDDLNIENYEKWKQKEENTRIQYNLLYDIEDKFSNQQDSYPSYEKWKEEQESLKGRIFNKKCAKCGSSKLELWDTKGRPCPKCGTRLQPDKNGLRMNWD